MMMMAVRYMHLFALSMRGSDCFLCVFIQASSVCLIIKEPNGLPRLWARLLFSCKPAKVACKKPFNNIHNQEEERIEGPLILQQEILLLRFLPLQTLSHSFSIGSLLFWMGKKASPLSPPHSNEMWNQVSPESKIEWIKDYQGVLWGGGKRKEAGKKKNRILGKEEEKEIY